MMTRGKPHHIRFHLALMGGSLLGVVLLVVSVVTYAEVSRSLVTTELRREVQRQLNTLQAEATHAIGRKPPRNEAEDAAQLNQVLDDIRQDAPNKIAWMRVINLRGETVAQSGTVVGPDFNAEQLREVSGVGSPIADRRRTPAGRVLVVLHAVRLPRWPGMELPQGRAPGAGSGRHFVETAVYWESGSEAFSGLQANLILSSLAALGLVLSMVLLWSRFPHYVKGKQLEQQTELARRVQADLLPPAKAGFDELDFAAECLPAEYVGGDFYDAYSTADGRIAIILGDVSGKGLPASVLMSLLLGAVNSSDWLAGCTEHESASRRLSELLRTRTSPDRFASLFWCYYDPETQLLRYVNAGHPPPIVWRRNGAAQVNTERLREGGPVLGVVPAAEYCQGNIALCTGDVLVLYSDGVVEASDASGEQFGEERLLDTLRENCHRPPAEIRDEVLKRVHKFVGGSRMEDDVTLVIARVPAAA